MLYQMIRSVDMSGETFDKYMKYKFFIPIYIKLDGNPVMSVLQQGVRTNFYSEGNKILDEV